MEGSSVHVNNTHEPAQRKDVFYQTKLVGEEKPLSGTMSNCRPCSLVQVQEDNAHALALIPQNQATDSGEQHKVVTSGKEKVTEVERTGRGGSEDAREEDVSFINEEEEEEQGDCNMGSNSADDELGRLSSAFFLATTKPSTDNEDILPQEDSDEMKLSVFSIFAGLFPDAVGEHGAGAQNKRLRLHFNKAGYQIYSKEQSRRVPAVRAKPGNPGYGFRRARWRDTICQESDRQHCEKVLRDAGCSKQRILAVAQKVQETCLIWDTIRRPSRPAGPGRPRRSEESSSTRPAVVVEPVEPVEPHKTSLSTVKSPKMSPLKKSSISCKKSWADPKKDDEKGEDKLPGSASARKRKERAELREDLVPNLVKDEDETHPGCGRGVSPLRASPVLYCLPLPSAGRGAGAVVAALSRAASGCVGSDRGIKKSVDGLGGMSRSEGDEKEGASKKVKHSTRLDGQGWENGIPKSTHASPCLSAGSAHESDSPCATLPPLKLDEAKMTSTFASALPPISNMRAYYDSRRIDTSDSFSGLEKLASLASSSEKMSERQIV